MFLGNQELFLPISADTVTAASFHDRHNTWEGNNGGSAYSPMNSLIVDPPAYNYHPSATNTPCVQQDPRSSAPVRFLKKI